MATSDEDRERHRWWLLRDAPRHDSGVLYATGAEGEVWIQSIAEAVPFLVSTSDFAPADMQYRMHRSLLWSRETGLYGEAFDVDHNLWLREEPSVVTNARVAEAMARALHVGGEGVPAEMRWRWQRETAAHIAVCAGLDLDIAAAELLNRAAELGRADDWLGLAQ